METKNVLIIAIIALLITIIIFAATYFSSAEEEKVFNDGFNEGQISVIQLIINNIKVNGYFELILPFTEDNMSVNKTVRFTPQLV